LRERQMKQILKKIHMKDFANKDISSFGKREQMWKFMM
jgi:hypothetical protein